MNLGYLVHKMGSVAFHSGTTVGICSVNPNSKSVNELRIPINQFSIDPTDLLNYIAWFIPIKLQILVVTSSSFLQDIDIS